MKKYILLTLLTIGIASCVTKETKQYNIKNLEKHSEKFLRIRYQDSPLGEGEKGLYDKDPLFRFDRFDCLTYVETVMAIYLAENNKKKFEKVLKKIRYKDGKISFPTRNHFMSADWIPNNIKQGYTTDITKKIAPGQYKIASAFIQKSEWYKKLKPPYFLHNGEIANDSVASIPYIPTEKVINDQNLINRIPSGAIISIVRPNWNLKKAIGTTLNISHLGFVFHKTDGTTIFRHASSLKGRVVDVPLVAYLNELQKNPTIKGIHILKIRSEVPLDF